MSFSSAKRIVVKLGTQVVMEGDGPALDRLRGIATELAFLLREGKEVLLVSSGAVGLGRRALSLQGALSVEDKQACAAVGQSLLMNTYRDLLSPYRVVPAQILLTADDFSYRTRYLTLQKTLTRLIEMKTLPVINENDTVSAAGLRENVQRSFDDNDKLSALVAGKLNADVLLILTNVDGVYTDNPAENPNATVIREIADNEVEIRTGGTSSMGRGGMASKLASARLAGMCGVTTIISSGLGAEAIGNALRGEVGTCVRPRKELSERKRWIGFSSGYSGVIVVNNCAREVLHTNKSSLLPIGVTGVQGEFSVGEVVSVQDEEGREIGRGITELPSNILLRVMGKHSREARELESSIGKDEVIHRDHLVIFEEEL